MGMEFNSEDMLDLYLQENNQLLEKLQEIVLEQKDEECFDEDSINEIFRTMHTIKGSSGVMMFDDIMNLSHKLEDVFFYIRESSPDNVPHVELVAIVLEVADFISGEMDKLSNGDRADGVATDLIEKIDEFLNSIKGTPRQKAKVIQENVHEEPEQFYIAPKPTGDSKYYRLVVHFRPETAWANIHAYKTVSALKEVTQDISYYPADVLSNESTAEVIMENGFKIMLKTDAMVEHIEETILAIYEVETVDISEENQSAYETGFTADGEFPRLIDLESSIEEIEAKAEAKEGEEAAAEEKKPFAPGDFVIEDKEPGKAKKLAKDKAKKNDKAAFISVDIHKMDMLMDLIGELVISESVVLQNPDLKVPGLSLENFNKAAAQMAKISTDLQNVIMSMRMVPLTTTFQKMNRIVFDASRKLGKEIEFEMVGETTEVDKNIIEHISDPLMHLVRNAVDHGIETPEEREKAGKTEKAKVTLSAKTESGKVWIGVQDNGAGLDRVKILEKARRQGILDETRPDSSYTDKEVYQFITLPGFSTNEKVTEFSGRGVGMDVVVSNIQAIGGSLEIESTPGEGSMMLLKIPLTLAIIDGIVMKVGDASFVIETGMVKEFVSVQKEMVVHEPSGEEYVMLRGEAYPVLRIGELYHMEHYEQEVEKGMMVVIQVEQKMSCIFVDSLVGKQEIVVKPIPDYVKKVKGLSGCTQLGDGSIALILDAAGLVE